eukprot:m.8552 g.8552  ORF g.8552 m.8552 type:complete len:173 (-) comp3920_c0_seq1:121-639(-)
MMDSELQIYLNKHGFQDTDRLQAIDTHLDGREAGLSTLHFTAINDQPNLVAEVLKLRPKLINSRESHGRTALNCLAGKTTEITNDTLEVCKILIKQKADVNTRDMYRKTPLHRLAVSSCAGADSMAKILLDSNADPRLECDEDLTPLKYALRASGAGSAKLTLLLVDSAGKY